MGFKDGWLNQWVSHHAPSRRRLWRGRRGPAATHQISPTRVACLKVNLGIFVPPPLLRRRRLSSSPRLLVAGRWALGARPPLPSLAARPLRAPVLLFPSRSPLAANPHLVLSLSRSSSSHPAGRPSSPFAVRPRLGFSPLASLAAPLRPRLLAGPARCSGPSKVSTAIKVLH